MTKVISGRLQVLFCFIFIFSITYFAAKNYLGNVSVLYAFSSVFFLFLWIGLSTSNQFFSLFLTLFLTLGFWLKLVYHLLINDFNFMRHTAGAFQFTGSEFDKALIYIVSGILGFSLSILIGNFLFQKMPKTLGGYFQRSDGAIEKFYYQYKYKILVATTLFVLAVAIFNVKFQIFQRGVISQSNSTVLKSFMALALMFGLSAVTSFFVSIEYKNRHHFFAAGALAFFESFVSSVSLLSRGFILNAGSFLLVFIQIFKKTKMLSAKTLVAFVLLFITFTVISVKLVSISRSAGFKFSVTTDKPIATNSWFFSASGLLIDRWVGLEGVMSAVSYPEDRQNLFKKLWTEKMTTGTSLYDKEVINSYYARNPDPNSQFITLPGFIGWLSFLDNIWILFFGAFGVGLFCLSLEFFIESTTQNIFFCSLIGQTLAYRISHFGYLPQQSYKLILGIIFVWFGYLAFKVILGWYLDHKKS